jgi:hypothetical protein
MIDVVVFDHFIGFFHVLNFDMIVVGFDHVVGFFTVLNFDMIVVVDSEVIFVVVL